MFFVFELAKNRNRNLPTELISKSVSSVSTPSFLLAASPCFARVELAGFFFFRLRILRLINSMIPIDETSRLSSITVQSQVSRFADHITTAINSETTIGLRTILRAPYSKSTSCSVTIKVAAARPKPNNAARSMPSSTEIRLTRTAAPVNKPKTHPSLAECGPR